MTVYRVLGDIVDALRTSHLELQDLGTEIKNDLAVVGEQVRKLGVELVISEAIRERRMWPGQPAVPHDAGVWEPVRLATAGAAEPPGVGPQRQRRSHGDVPTPQAKPP